MNRTADIAKWTVRVETRADGVLLVEAVDPLGPWRERMTDCLDHWAEHRPDQTFLAERIPGQHGAGSEWRTISYAEIRRQARSVARHLLLLGLNAEHPLAILSGNSIEHAVVALGAMYAGIPYAPLSPAWSLVSTDFVKLRDAIALLTPGAVYVDDGDFFARPLAAAVPAEIPVIVMRNPRAGHADRLSEELLVSDDADLPVVTPDAVAKILFTSGSTSVPKGVMTTHRMLAANQQMLLSVFPFLAEEPLVICDWLSWHHVFGGSHNFGLVLYNGGTLYMDDGRPVPGAFDETLRNLREISPTVYFNVPKGYEMLAAALRTDAELRKCFFSRLRMTFYSAASLSQDVWDELDRLALETIGVRIPMLTGLGATETAPFSLCADADNTRAGVVGLPVPGLKLKLAPVEGKLEARVKGPNVMPGYWRQPELTSAAFDDEGYYRMGDAVRFVDEQNPHRGFVFDGRISEDFKLTSGTWVSVGPLRTRFLAHCAPYLRDVVIAGHGRDEVTALLFPERGTDRSTLGSTLERLLSSFAEQSTGSSNRIVRALVLDTPPSLDAGEITDKGSINQLAVLRCRAREVEVLYSFPFAPEILLA